MKFVLAALLLLGGGYVAWDWLRVDTCLDRGGMWAGPMGCQTELPKIDRIVIDKSDRKLMAFERGRKVAEMDVALGRDPVGDKRSEGDNRTPEGIYPVTAHKFDSAYYRALRLGYPTPVQQAQAKRDGRDPGGDIMIHGIRNGVGWVGSLHRVTNWTRGCVAVTNGEIDWLYQSAADGTPVEIRA
jgi:murein L,D-transpeptidase YafK